MNIDKKVKICHIYSIFYLFFTFIDKNYCFLKSNHCDQTAFLIRIILFTFPSQGKSPQLQFFIYFLKLFCQLDIFTVIHRTVNQRQLILLKGMVQCRQKILCFFNAVPFDPEALCIFSP